MRTTPCCLAFLLLAGCASYSITKDGTGDGYDVFRPEPYLLVVRGENDGKQEVTADVVWLPNYAHRYRIDTSNFLAKADFAFSISEGWMLTSIADKSDNTSVAGELAKALTEIVKATGAPAPRPVSLYRIEFDDDGHAVKLVEVALP